VYRSPEDRAADQPVAAQVSLLHELAGAVLTHFDSDASSDAIDAAERERIKVFAREQSELDRDP
jgi:hypothetical protein